ncbi:MAG: DUF3291 domain-containing protein [Myxococcales bacterium]|nr:DUF3291 domain-containing protein [Myxococcales bacterium]
MKTTAFFSILLALSACGTDDQDAVDGPDAMVADEADAAPPAAVEPTIEALEACEAEAFEPPALEGPGMGAPPEGAVVASATVLYLRPGAAAKAQFLEVLGPVAATLATSDGLLAQALTYDDRCGVARTFTVWRDAAAMYGFVASPAHVAAMAQQGEFGRPESTVVHWEVDADAFPPTWDEALDVVRAAPSLGER